MSPRSGPAFAMVAAAVVANVILACSAFTAEEAPSDGQDAPVGEGAAGDAAAQGESSPSTDAPGADVPSSDSTPPVVGCNGKVACSRLVFVTNQRFTGLLGGLAGADEKCKMAADNSTNSIMRDRKWVAWLSGTGTPASARLVHGTMPYRRTDGAAIVQSYTELVSGATLANPPSFTENSLEVSGPVWTGTSDQGAALAENCTTWSSSTVGQGRTGEASRDDTRWTNEVDMSCALTARLYCFEL
jgi:hypothetical protein